MSQEKISSPHWTAHASEIKEQDGVIYIPAKALNIIWGNDNRYWQWTTFSNNEINNFSYGAELLQVNWIEVTGKVDFTDDQLMKLSSITAGEYEIIYVVKFKVDAFGWHSSPIRFKVATTSDGHQSSCQETSELLEHYRKTSDKWHEIRGGKFTVPSSRHGSVQFGMYETQSDWWKGSMILAGVKVRPAHKG